MTGGFRRFPVSTPPMDLKKPGFLGFLYAVFPAARLAETTGYKKPGFLIL